MDCPVHKTPLDIVQIKDKKGETKILLKYGYCEECERMYKTKTLLQILNFQLNTHKKL
jgi:uncharacterized protein YbaR (Trm112 family)